MTTRHSFAAVAALCAPLVALAASDAGRGAEAFRACAGCHSLVAGEHRSGPSLAAVYGRRAGTAEGFQHYSDALHQSAVVWNEQTLDTWLRDPAAFIPGNAMAFRGLPDAHARSDLIAYLRAVSEGKIAAPRTPGLPDLKSVAAGQRVSAIRHCGDTYHVTLGEGRVYRSGSSTCASRPTRPRRPAQGRAGHRRRRHGRRPRAGGVRNPAEISAFIHNECESP